MAVTYDLERVLDDAGWQILQALQEDARMSYAEIGRRVSLSSPAVAERIARLEEAGVIEGFHARVNYARAGYPVQAVIRIDTQGHDDPDRAARMFERVPEVIQAHRMTGPDCYVAHVVARDLKRLKEVIDTLAVVGRTTTGIVLDTPLARKTIGPDVDATK